MDCFIVFAISFLLGFGADGFLLLRHNENVPAIDRHSVELLCLVETDELVKEVIWYKVLDNAPKRIVYYYEPPKFNLPGPFYLGRTKLAADMSSLVFNSVQSADEGVYQCHVAVVTNQNQSVSAVRIPDSKVVTTKLEVFVPPSDVKLTAFASNKNLTLTCRSSQSKPSAVISWMVTNKLGKSRSVKSTKVVSEAVGQLVDTIGYLQWPLTAQDDNTTFECVVRHPDTQTTLKRDLIIVAPYVTHPVSMDFDWMSGTVPYTSFESVDAEQKVFPGLVVMEVFPSRVVPVNSTVVITVTSQGAFPEPSFSWWADVDGALQGGTNKLTLPRLSTSQVYYCLVENALGRVAMSVQLTVDGSTGPEGDKDANTGSAAGGEDAALASGLMVAAIAFGALVLMFLVSFVIYYFACKRVQEEKQNNNLGGVGGVEEGEFDSYVVKQKPYLATTAQPTGQTKEKEYQNSDVAAMTTEEQALLRSSPPEKRKEDFDSSSEATTTSDYEEDPKESAINKHLHDFDENASFVGDYGSSFGLDRAPGTPHVEPDSSFDRGSVGSYHSDGSGAEGRYTLPHDSWEHIDPRQTVGAP